MNAKISNRLLEQHAFHSVGVKELRRKSNEFQNVKGKETILPHRFDILEASPVEHDIHEIRHSHR